ncbi:hypothetical protein [Neobacillus sp. 204]
MRLIEFGTFHLEIGKEAYSTILASAFFMAARINRRYKCYGEPYHK